MPALWPPCPRIPSWGCQGGQQSFSDTVRGPAFRYQTLSAGQAIGRTREADQDTGHSRGQASVPGEPTDGSRHRDVCDLAELGPGSWMLGENGLL